MLNHFSFYNCILVYTNALVPSRCSIWFPISLETNTQVSHLQYTSSILLYLENQVNSTWPKLMLLVTSYKSDFLLSQYFWFSMAPSLLLQASKMLIVTMFKVLYFVSHWTNPGAQKFWHMAWHPYSSCNQLSERYAFTFYFHFIRKTWTHVHWCNYPISQCMYKIMQI